MKMSRRLRFFLFLVIATVICLIRAKCTQAESASDVTATEEPWFLPYGVATTPIPAPVDELPVPTSLPSGFFNIEAIQKQYEKALRASDLQATKIYYKPYTITRIIASGTYVFQDISLTGGSHTATNMYWIPGNDELLDLEENMIDDYKSVNLFYYKNQYLFSTYTSQRQVNFRMGSFGWSFKDVPETTEINRNCTIDYTLSASELNLMFGNGATDPLHNMGITESFMDSFTLIAVVNVYSHNASEYTNTLKTFKWSEFKAGVTISVPFKFLEEDDYAQQIVLHIILDPKIDTNPVYAREQEYYNEQQTPWGDQVFYSYGVTGTGIKFGRVVNLSDDGYKMKWYEKLIFPDPDWTAAYLSDFVGSLSQSSSFSWAIAFRGLIYNILTGSSSQTGGRPIITIPQLTIMGHTWFNGATFNLKAFLDQHFPALLNYVKIAINVLITTVFLNSLTTAVFGLFGLKLYDGVRGEDVGEGDV